MAVYKIFPTKDASIYSQFPSENTGLDEILQVSSYYYLGNRYKSRYLIQFSTPEIQNIINTKINGASFGVFLKNFNANITGLSVDTNLYFYQVSGSWEMGTGQFNSSPEINNGVSWDWKDISGSILWVNGGGDYYPTPIASQSFGYSNPIDINVDVTPNVISWYSGSSQNNGFLVKLSDSVENSNNNNIQPIFKYFSIDTHTIYPPCLEFKWDDYSFNTGSSSNIILGTSEAFINVYNNVGVYYSESVAKMRLAAIPKYPQRVFQTSSLFVQNFYLPESESLYAIKDSTTNEFIVNFDPDYTRISADATSSYFNLYMNGLEPERYYTILIQTQLEGITKVWDENIMFKVSKK